MKKNNKKRKQYALTLAIGVGIVLLLGLLLVYNVVKIKNEEFKSYIINELKKDVNEGEKLKVNSVNYGSKRIVFDNLKLEIKHSKLYVDGELKFVDDDDLMVLTAYYYQPTNTYNIYVLTDDDEVYALTNVTKSKILESEFRELEIEDVDRLVLADVTIENELFGRLPEKYRVYVVSDGRLVLVR